MAWVGLHLDLVLGSEVVVVTATNVKDAVARHMYQITSGNEGSSFSINTSTGVSVFFFIFLFWKCSFIWVKSTCILFSVHTWMCLVWPLEMETIDLKW